MSWYLKINLRRLCGLFVTAVLRIGLRFVADTSAFDGIFFQPVDYIENE